MMPCTSFFFLLLIPPPQSRFLSLPLASSRFLSLPLASSRFLSLPMQLGLGIHAAVDDVVDYLRYDAEEARSEYIVTGTSTKTVSAHTVHSIHECSYSALYS
jgi:hypothetical protein